MKENVVVPQELAAPQHEKLAVTDPRLVVPELAVIKEIAKAFDENVPWQHAVTLLNQ